MDMKEDQVVVIMVPFMAQSHLNQALQLSCQISSYNIPVHYACSATHIHQAKLRFNNLNRHNLTKIHFHEFPTPHFHSPLPNPNENFPIHLLPSFDASVHLRDPMAALLRQISSKARRVVVIHDFNMTYVVQDVNTLPNVESYCFNPISAFTYFLSGLGLDGGKSFEVEEPEGLPSSEGTITVEIANFCGLQIPFLGLDCGTIVNSCRSIEGTYIDLLAKQQNSINKQLWVLGPLHLLAEQDGIRNSNSRHKCLDWLDKQAPNSVLYVSFGTTSSFTDEAIKELAEGLEQSEQKFIWVFQEADKADIFANESVKRSAELPEGYEERVKGVGLVVRDWAPQLEILGHPSTGGFMSHCGWNSCLESITMGVPIAAWPMHSDQPRNAFLVTDVLKVGVVVKQWAHRDELVTASTIAAAVKRLMASTEGKAMKKRVEELSAAAQESVKEGGVSRIELETFVAYITR